MYKILIVDDEPDVVSLLKDYFEISGYETFSAYSGAEAMDKVQIKPDMILLDVNMPRMDGMEVCRKTCPMSISRS